MQKNTRFLFYYAWIFKQIWINSTLTITLRIMFSIKYEKQSWLVIILCWRKEKLILLLLNLLNLLSVTQLFKLPISFAITLLNILCFFFSYWRTFRFFPKCGKNTFFFLIYEAFLPVLIVMFLSGNLQTSRLNWRHVRLLF